MSETGLKNFVAYCGLYCNACGIRQGKIKTAVKSLRDIITGYGFDKTMSELSKWEPSFEHYDKFNQVMDGLVKLFGDCPGCFQGGGDPNCKIRYCVKEKDYRTCAECKDNETCEHWAPLRKDYGLSPALQSIKQKGIEKYVEEMQDKVDEGECYT
jgi:hypothetical protein